MQLGSSTIPLLPALAVGVALVLAGLVLWGVRRARREPAAAAALTRRDAVDEAGPFTEDRTGEAADGGPGSPAPRRMTVADAVAARNADTGPLRTGSGPPTAARPRRADDAAGPDAPGPVPSGVRAPRHARHTAPDALAASAATPAAVVAPGRTDARDVRPAADPDAGPDARVRVDSVPDATDLPRGTVPDVADDAEDLALAEHGAVPPPWSSARAGTAPAAVRQTLAAREALRARPQQPDTRDRLLAVLLSDPAAALGATDDLDDTRRRIERLGEVLRRRRTDLAGSVHRLHSSGLTDDQIGRLAGLDSDDVHAIRTGR